MCLQCCDAAACMHGCPFRRPQILVRSSMAMPIDVSIHRCASIATRPSGVRGIALVDMHVRMSVHWSIHMPVHMSVHRSIHMSVRMSLHMPVRMCVRVSVHMPAHVYAHV